MFLHSTVSVIVWGSLKTHTLSQLQKWTWIFLDENPSNNGKVIHTTVMCYWWYTVQWIHFQEGHDTLLQYWKMFGEILYDKNSYYSEFQKQHSFVSQQAFSYPWNSDDIIITFVQLDCVFVCAKSASLVIVIGLSLDWVSNILPIISSLFWVNSLKQDTVVTREIVQKKTILWFCPIQFNHCEMVEEDMFHN